MGYCFCLQMHKNIYSKNCLDSRIVMIKTKDINWSQTRLLITRTASSGTASQQDMLTEGLTAF